MFRLIEGQKTANKTTAFLFANRDDNTIPPLERVRVKAFCDPVAAMIVNPEEALALITRGKMPDRSEEKRYGEILLFQKQKTPRNRPERYIVYYLEKIEDLYPYVKNDSGARWEDVRNVANRKWLITGDVCLELTPPVAL